MEAAAVAWAAELYAVPYFALKVVTDIGKYMFLLKRNGLPWIFLMPISRKTMK